MVRQDFIEILLHEPKHFAVSLGNDRRFAVDVEQDAERAEVIASAHLTDDVLTVWTQALQVASNTIAYNASFVDVINVCYCRETRL